jgi:adenylate cyclase
MTELSPPGRFSRFLRELKRRKVYQVGAVYVVVGFAVAQGAEYLFEMIGLPVVASRAVLILAILGLPLALVLAWAYELRPDEGPAEGRSLRQGSAPEPEGGVLSEPGASIVVLPFDNFSPDPSDAYFADGLTEEITASLASVHDLRVTSRNSATVIKKEGADTQAIATRLGVGYVLEGSVRKAGEALRITAQLIRADTDEHLWSERFDWALSDVFGMQEEVARSIVRILELHLKPDEDRRLAARPMDDLRAYESYLKAREESLRWSRVALEHALEHLEQARDRVGENAVVLAGIGYVYSQFANMGLYDRDYLALSEEHARRALDLDPDNPEANMVLGFLYQEGLRDVDLSVYHLERSLDVKPDDPHALTWYILALSLAGYNDEMTAAAERLLEVDPLTPMSHGMLGLTLQIRGDLEGGLAKMTAWRRNDPDGVAAAMFHAHALAAVGRSDEALTILREEFTSDAQEMWPFLGRLLRSALEKDAAGMDAVMTENFRKKADRDLQFSYFTASFHALAGRRDETLEWLRFNVARGFRNYPWMAENDPWLPRYRDDPEFREVFEEVRKAWARGIEVRAGDA